VTPEPPGPRRKPPIPWYYWPFWMLVLAGALFIFYVVFTPVWIAIRLAAWFSEHRFRAT
jgi:hypothetical protein